MKNIILLSILLFPYLIFSQIDGVIYEKIEGEKVPIENASIFFKNGRQGKTTCEEGMFLFEFLPRLPDTLVVRAMGYYNDTIPIGKKDKQLYLDIQLYSDNLLEEVVIAHQRENSNVLRLDPRNTEQLNSGELRKAACCNLSESFETNATVDVNISDGVSGAKRISMMGLDGAYTQIQFENFPILQNLDLASGLNGIPGTWINSIQITKGTGTVVNGYESMAGLINLEYHKPENMDKVYLNAYGSIQGRGELNVQTSTQLSERWSTALFGHVSTAAIEIDRNNDGFRDIPIGEEYVFFNRWKYNGDQLKQQFGIKGNYSDKNGGQIGFDRRNMSQNLYGVSSQNLHVEAFGKTGWLFKDKPYRSLGLLYYAKYHEMDVRYGNRELNAKEERGYFNLMYEDILGSTMHVIKTGASFVYDDLDQLMTDNIPSESLNRTLNRTEMVPGVYGEYTYTGLRATFVGGVRTDYHNMFGWQHSPRANFKYKLQEKMDVRLTAGRGFRVPNYVVDNMRMMATNLPWIVGNEIRPEVSWNFGGSWFYQFELFKRKASLNADFYHTLFTNQLVVDRDEDPSMIIFDNLQGQSFSNAFQVDFKFEPYRNLEIKMAYKYLDVRATMGGELMEKMMIPRHRGFVNVGYTTRNNRWEFDATASVYGERRLAQVRLPDGTLSTDNRSDILPMINAQITHVYKRFDFYVGGENLLDFRLENPIIDAQNPFGDHFDATRVWAPIVGINIYAGIRFSIGKD